MEMSDTPVSLSRNSLATMSCVTRSSDFRRLQHDWRQLHGSLNHTTPFNSWEWLFSWWQAYGEGKELRICEWRSGGALVGIAPLCLVHESVGIGPKYKVIRFIGDGSHDSDYLDFIILPEFFSVAISQFTQWLQENTEWDAIVFREIREVSALPNALRKIAYELDLLSRFEFGRAFIVPLPSSFNEFLQARQPRFRTKIRSSFRKFGHSGDVVFEDDFCNRDLRRRLYSLFTLHQKRWHHANLPGVFGERAKRLFYMHFVPRFARNGWLRLYSLRGKDGYLAHQLCFGSDGTTYLLQEGFDIVDAAASYGQFLRAAVMRHLIEKGERYYDFLSGYSKHKLDWGGQENKTIHCILSHKRRGRFYFRIPIWRDRLGSLLRRCLPESLYEMLRRFFPG